ncbi:WD40 repeat domain-containing protein, partial [Singulisphaera rosea]
YAHARQAETEKQAALDQAYRACVAAANSALQNKDVADASRHLASAPAALRGWEWHHLSNRLDDSSLKIPLSAEDVGVLVAAPDRLEIGSMSDLGLRLTDLDGASSKVIPIHSGRGPDAFSASQTRQGLRIASWVGKSSFDLLDDSGSVLCRVQPRVTEPVPVVMSPDGTRLACTFVDGDWKRISIFDATTGKPTGVCDGHRESLWSLSFSPDGERLASCGEDGTACVWDVATGSLLATCRGHTSKVLGVAFDPNGNRLVTTSSDGTVRQWDSEDGRQVEPPYERHTGEVVTATYSPDGQWIASAGDDRTIRVWRARGGQDVTVLLGHTGGVIAVAFAPDGRRLASLSRKSIFVTASDQTIRVWDVDPESPLPVLRGHTAGIYPVTYSPDGRWIASGGWDRTERIWDATTGEACATLHHPYFVWDSAFGPDGTWLVTGIHHEVSLRFFDVALGRVRKSIPSTGLNFHSLAVNSDGTRVATTGFDPKSHKFRLTIIDRKSGKSVFWTEGASLSYSTDGRWLATVAADEKTVLLLDAKTHETVARFRGHEARVHKATFRPDNRLLATCSRDQTVRLWKLDDISAQSVSRDATEGRTGDCQVLRGHSDEVYAVAFHPDGSRLASGGRDGAVWLWDVARGVDVVRLPGHGSYIWSLAFSPDGATLASGSWDTTVRLWDTIP